jgi:hypothetical protein
LLNQRVLLVLLVESLLQLLLIFLEGMRLGFSFEVSDLDQSEFKCLINKEVVLEGDTSKDLMR